jgi:hypothetical protein
MMDAGQMKALTNAAFHNEKIFGAETWKSLLGNAEGMFQYGTRFRGVE